MECMFCGAEMEDGWVSVHVQASSRGRCYLGWTPAVVAERPTRWQRLRDRLAWYRMGPPVVLVDRRGAERLAAWCYRCDAVVIHPLEPVDSPAESPAGD